MSTIWRRQANLIIFHDLSCGKLEAKFLLNLIKKSSEEATCLCTREVMSRNGRFPCEKKYIVFGEQGDYFRCLISGCSGRSPGGDSGDMEWFEVTVRCSSGTLSFY